MANEIHSGDYGTQFKATFLDGGVVVNLSGYSALQFVFTKPANAAIGPPYYKYTRQATLFSDGTDGIAQYTTQSGEIDTLGTWQFQGYLQTPSGQWYSDISTFKVTRNL